jgi:autotransporter-associated beta strand protein
VLRDPNAIAGFQIFIQQGNGQTGNGTILVQTDGGDKPYDVAVSSLLNGTITLDRATAGTDVIHPFNSLSAGIATSVSFIPGASVSAGTATVTIDSVNLNSSFSGQSILAPLSAGAVPSVVTINSVTTSGGTGGQSKTVNFGGTTTGNTVTGSIDNGNGMLGVVKSGTSTWTLSGNLNYGGITQVTGGVLRIAPDVGTQAITSTPALSNTSAADGTDIQGGRLVLDYSHGQTTPVALLRDEVIAGRVIDSLNPVNKTVGYADDTTAKQVTALVTWSGDANIDGTVNALDFNILATNFGAGPAAYWFQGDFDHNGLVNTLDFNALATNFNQTGGIIPGALPGAPALGALVPEPASVVVLGMALLGLRRRRGL